MYGVPQYLTFDNPAEQCMSDTELTKHIKKHSINYLTIEPGFHNQKAVEGVIREARRK